MDLVETGSAPVPEGAFVEWVRAGDGTELRVARWCPPAARRGTVVLLHGRTEFIEKYFELIEELLERGYAVCTFDWRGQGRSQRPLANPHKGHVDDFAHYLADLRQVLDEVVLPHCPGPFVALAHSMGGNVALRFLAEHPEAFAAAMFSAPMWGLGRPVRPPWWMRALAGGASAVGLAGAYLPGGGDYGERSRAFEGNSLTRDPRRFERFAGQVSADPRLALGGATFGWARHAIRSIDAVHEPGFAEAIAVPICVCTGSEDAVVSGAAHRALVDRLPNAVHEVFSGALHEILMETDEHREQFLAAFDRLVTRARP